VLVHLGEVRRGRNVGRRLGGSGPAILELYSSVLRTIDLPRDAMAMIAGAVELSEPMPWRAG
jgi:hypothetical protein